MIIERNFSKFVVFSEDTVLSALNKINENKSRIIFAVSESGLLQGVLTDGDFRRWLTRQDKIDLDAVVSKVMNRDFQYANLDDSPSAYRTMLNERITAIPLVDHNLRLVAVALPQHNQCEIEGRVVSNESPAFVIAEIGNNHNGSLDLAKKLIDEAVKAGAESAKFQMRDMETLYKYTGSADELSADLGAQYTLDLLSRFQLPDDELFEAFDYCREKAIIPLCTPWDLSSLKKLENYGVQAYKVASADFTNYELIDAIAKTGKPMICSTGMSKEQEIQDGIQHLRSIGASFVLLHCNSTYPAPFKDINLKYMQHLKELSGGLVGYSGHERDIHVAVAAVSMGAKVIEKHFTLDKTMEGNDHKVSLLPAEFAKMVEGIRQVEVALGKVSERSLSQGEMMNRETLAKSLVAAVDIPDGTVLTEDMIDIRSPGQGLQPNKKNQLIGKITKGGKKKGEFFFPSDLGEAAVKARNYVFSRKWGVPVRYHDLQAIQQMSNVHLLEIHLSYKDMEVDFRKYINEPLKLGLVVHAPELFAGDHTMDLCSSDYVYRRHSINEMQKVIDLTRELTPFFNNSDKTLIVTNVGGFSHEGHIHHGKRAEYYSVLEDSLNELDMAGVEIIPQTMPPFPWHFGGQQFHNLFMDSDSIVEFCKKNSMRICLDTSHSKLACNYEKWSFSEFVKKVGPYVAHMHIADAGGVDGEGFQIGDGDIDWMNFVKLANEYAPTATFIPEIWQGHKNQGEGFWIALEKLESYFKDLS